MTTNPGPTRKKCGKCRRWRPRAEFHRRAAAEDGLKGWCKRCSRKAFARWRAENPEKAKAATRRVYERDIEKWREYGRRYNRARRAAPRRPRRVRSSP